MIGNLIWRNFIVNKKSFEPVSRKIIYVVSLYVITDENFTDE